MGSILAHQERLPALPASQQEFGQFRESIAETLRREPQSTRKGDFEHGELSV